MPAAKMIVGVDVGKEKLDICYPDGKKETVRNIKSCRTKVIKTAARINAIVCFEATGPYDEALAEECLARGVRAVRLDAWGARRFAESQGRIEKTDRIDCEIIRDYAASLKDEKLHFIKPRSEAQKRLKKNVCVRMNLMKARAIVYNQLEHIHDRESRRHLESSIAKLDREIARIETECDKAIADDERMKALSGRFLKVKSIGPCLVRTVFAYCPDIGTIRHKAKPKRGRSDLRKVLYMAAVSASRCNHILREFYRRLVARGKPRKVALTAVARRIAILLNNIAKYPDFVPALDPKDGAGAESRKR